MNLIDVRHPEYDDYASNWKLWRDVWEGGPEYINAYLVKFSARESDDDFNARKEISYNPAYAKSLINEIKNSIFQRLPDVLREGGPTSYQDAIKGDELGVDRHGSSMNAFMGVNILPELLVMRKVGIYVDMPQLNGRETLLTIKSKRPYVYRYQAEEILSWHKRNKEEFISVLLKETVENISDFGLPDGIVVRYRHVFLTENDTVQVDFYDEKGEFQETVELNISTIPFYVSEIEDSLMEDLAPYNNALLNLASSDINYSLKANFPFYVEPYEPRADNPYADTAEGKKINVGTVQGRAYPVGSQPPEFIHPSPEPLKVSMEKQAQMKEEMKELVHLKVTEMGRRASAESKKLDLGGLEAGLSYLGNILEKTERKIASLWSMYEGKKDIPTIVYPTTYDLKSDSDRLDESEKLIKIKSKVPSETFQKEASKIISRKTLGNKVPATVIKTIDGEIDNAKALDTDPDILSRDVELGILAKKHAAELKGYPKDTVELSQEEHAERAKVIAMSQSKPGARGVDDLSADPKQDIDEEKQKIKEDNPEQDMSRGEGK